MKDELVIGRVRTGFGTAGELKVESLSGESEHFLKLSSVTVRTEAGSQSYRVESVRTAHRAILLKLENIDSPESAAKLRGAELVVARENAAQLAPGEYYYADLVGLEVVLDGSPAGRVAAIRETGDKPLLEISSEAGGTALVPFADAFFGDVDLKAGRIELRDGAVLE